MRRYTRLSVITWLVCSITVPAIAQTESSAPIIKPRRVVAELPSNVEQHLGLVYASYGDRELHLDLFRPIGNGIRPAVVVVHGGGWLQGDRTKFHALAQALAARGFVAAAIEYRLGGEAKFPAAIHDCNAAVRWLRANAAQFGIDANRIAAVGGSAGGHLVGLMAAAPHIPSLQGDGGNPAQSSAIQSALVMAGPMELATGPVAERSRQQPAQSNSNRWLGKTIDEDLELYRLASPITHVSEKTPPMLFMTGEFDHPERNLATRDLLRQLGVSTGIRVYSQGNHGCWNQHPWFEFMVDDIEAFLVDSLRIEPLDNDPAPIAMPGGTIHRLTDRVELRLNEAPANGTVTMPRLNNPITAIYVSDDKAKSALQIRPEPAHWLINLPSLREQVSITVETIGRPYIPTLPRIVSSNGLGKLTLDAHDAVTHGEKLRYEPQPHKNTVGYWTNEDDWCEWHFYSERSGQFDIHVLQGCGQGQGGSEVAVSVAKQQIKFIVEDTGHFQNFKDRVVGSITLPSPGVYTLQIRPVKKAANAVMDVRQVCLTPRESP